mgnify:CR=1 FL=1
MLMRFDPFRELDRLTEAAWSGGRTAMAMDAYRSGDRFYVELDLPGIDPDSIDLTVEKDVLTISAERRSHRPEDAQVLVAERPHGSVTRQLFLGKGLDVDHIDARYEQGVLVVTIPVAEAAKPRKVTITRGEGGSSHAIEATSSEGDTSANGTEAKVTSAA